MIYLIVLSAPDVVRERHGRVLSSEIWWRPDRHSDCPYISLTYSHTLRQIGSKIRTKCYVCRLSDSTTLDIITFKRVCELKNPNTPKQLAQCIWVGPLHWKNAGTTCSLVRCLFNELQIILIFLMFLMFLQSSSLIVGMKKKSFKWASQMLKPKIPVSNPAHH